jgi:hypothetical protein
MIIQKIMHLESAKNTIFVKSPNLKVLIKNVLFHRKRTKKVSGKKDNENIEKNAKFRSQVDFR